MPPLAGSLAGPVPVLEGPVKAAEVAAGAGAEAEAEAKPPKPPALRQYVLTASRYGGEHTIGTLESRTAAHWLGRGHEAFERRALGMDDCDDESDGSDGSGGEGAKGGRRDGGGVHELPEWYEIDGILHLNAPEWATGNSILVEELQAGANTARREVVTIEMATEEADARVASVTDHLEVYRATHPDLPAVVYGQSFEKVRSNLERPTRCAPTS